MNWADMETQWRRVRWHHVKRLLKAKWAKLTDDDVLSVAGEKERLVAKLQLRYGMPKEEATTQIDDWLATLAPMAAT
jgi:uncharacterized protein YjbJ (UPF0337 family)